MLACRAVMPSVKQRTSPERKPSMNAPSSEGALWELLQQRPHGTESTAVGRQPLRRVSRVELEPECVGSSLAGVLTNVTDHVLH